MILEDNFAQKVIQKAEIDGKKRCLITSNRLEDGTIKISGRTCIDFCSNDYLGLSFHHELRQAGKNILSNLGCGAGASRLMSGNMTEHEALEERIASFKHKKAALLFGSGYLANVGIIPSLVSRGDVVLSDRLNHASIVDGIRLSGAKILRFRHNDLSELENLLSYKRDQFKKALIVAESVYSMDGDMAPIDELINLSINFNTMLMIDEAHAVGIMGKKGEGLVSAKRAKDVDFIIGTFGKAFGGYGAFVVLSNQLKEYLIQSCRTFIFSTAIPPFLAAVNLAGVNLASSEAELKVKVLENARLFRKIFKEYTNQVIPGESQILPVVVGKNRAAVELEKALFDAGIFARAIRPPTVPEGTARIRFSVTAMHSRDQIEFAATTAAKQLRNF